MTLHRPSPTLVALALLAAPSVAAAADPPAPPSRQATAEPTQAQRAAVAARLYAADQAYADGRFDVALREARTAAAEGARLGLPNRDIQMLAAGGLVGLALAQLGNLEGSAAALRAVHAGRLANGDATPATARDLIATGLNLAQVLSELATQRVEADPAGADAALDEAERVLRDTVARIDALRRAAPTAPEREARDLDAATAGAALASILLRRQLLSEAEAAYRRAAAAHRAIDPGGVETANAANSHATLLLMRARPEEAIEIARAARSALAPAVYGRASQAVETDLRLRHTTVVALEASGRLAEAEIERRALRPLLSAEPRMAAEAAANLNGLGLTYARLGRPREAEDAYRTALTAWDAAPDDVTLGRAITADNLAVLLIQDGRSGEAEPLLAAGLRSGDPTSHVALARRMNRAIALVDLGQIGEAATEMAAVVDTLRRLDGATSVRFARAATSLALLEAQRGRAAEAAALHRAALDARRAADCVARDEAWNPATPRCPGSAEFVDLAWDAAWISLLQGERRAAAAHRTLQAAARQSLRRTLPNWPQPDAEAEFSAAQALHRDAVSAAWAVHDPVALAALSTARGPRADAALDETSVQTPLGEPRGTSG